ncbi:MAG: Alkaline phosphatase synthesis sensor protein PhoR [Candidatus Heimdallarchaeota archaeon LC_3]|nr:MAG: Alkaline phosphatase synthesis sensor protein PhoR [Candidatus Heimdallarchaeota archaeon LC_3]OLS21574.1 MAG: Alkaline phosphatase synthesis sensor protein PhoR [Candidatus Heimdallarchaeota archaeon LC_3]
MHPDDREIFLDSLEITRKNKIKTEFQYRLRLNNNKINEFHLTQYVTDNKQTNLLIFGLNFNISKVRIKEREDLFTENRWKIALEHSNIGVWDANLLSKKIFFSKQWKEILGYQEHEITDQADEWDRRVHPEDYQRIITIINEHLVGQTSEYIAEYRMRCKDDSYKWVLAHGKVLRNDKNEPVRLIGTHADITDRKLMDNKLRLSQENLVKKVEEKTEEVLKEKYRIETMLDAISDSILVLSNNGLLYYANNSFKALFERACNQTLPKKFIIYDLCGLKLIDSILKIITSKDPKPVIIEPTDGIYFQTSLVHIFLPYSNQPLGTMIELRDITKFQIFENMRKHFVSNVSHELRTPITSISLSINNLIKYKNKMSAVQINETLSMIKESSELLNLMIEELLIISRIESGKIELNMSVFSIIEIISEVKMYFTPQLKSKNIDLIADVNPDLQFYGDSSRINQIIRILIENAIKYSHEYKKIEIKILKNYLGEYNPEILPGILIQVIDEGIGIKQHELPFVFERFFRSEDVREIQGTGLGLSIAKEIIELHKGQIYVKSNSQIGSIFSAFLPDLRKDEAPK